MDSTRKNLVAYMTNSTKVRFKGELWLSSTMGLSLSRTYIKCNRMIVYLGSGTAGEC